MIESSANRRRFARSAHTASLRSFMIHLHHVRSDGRISSRDAARDDQARSASKADSRSSSARTLSRSGAAKPCFRSVSTRNRGAAVSNQCARNRRLANSLRMPKGLSRCARCDVVLKPGADSWYALDSTRAFDLCHECASPPIWSDPDDGRPRTHMHQPSRLQVSLAAAVCALRRHPGTRYPRPSGRTTASARSASLARTAAADRPI